MHRVLARITVAALVLLSGCATTPADIPASEQGYSHEVIRVGFAPDYPPLLFKEFGHLCGIEVDLAEIVVDELNAPIELHEMQFHELIPSLERGDIDVIIAALSVTAERAQQVRFLTPYMRMGKMALVRAVDAELFATPAELKAADIVAGVLAGSTSEQYARDNMAGQHRSFVTADAAVNALRMGTLEVVIADGLFVMLQAQDDPALAALPWVLQEEELAWAVSRAPQADVLYNELNERLRAARRRGDVDRIVDRYVDVIVDAE
jgi:polar amino acid transport system substrate-binding protein